MLTVTAYLIWRKGSATPDYLTLLLGELASLQAHLLCHVVRVAHAIAESSTGCK